MDGIGWDFAIFCLESAGIFHDLERTPDFLKNGILNDLDVQTVKHGVQPTFLWDEAPQKNWQQHWGIYGIHVHRITV